MVARSISVRTITNFSIPQSPLEIKNAKVPLGTIRKANTILTVSGSTFDVYQCSFSKDISDDITVFINELDDYKEFSSYKKSFNFNIYYSKKKQLLFSEATTPITKAFLKALSKMDGVQCTYKAPALDFDSISSHLNTTRGIRFDSNDTGVDRKAFNGHDIIDNSEAHDAIVNDDATQIIGELDLGGDSYTIMISKSGTIVSYTTLFAYQSKEKPMLEFSIDVMKELEIIK